MVLTLPSQENPQRTKKRFKLNKIQNQKFVPKLGKSVIKNHFWCHKEPFWFSFLETFQEV